MKIAKSGRSHVAAGLAAVAAGAALSRAAGLGGLGGSLAAAGAALAGFMAYFFRDPDRPLPEDDRKLYATGDGRVLSVGREGPDETVTLRVFLSPFDVHIQRAPCAGVVESVKFERGGFAAAMKEDARRNERCVMTLRPDSGGGPVVLEQITGFLVRRIECWVEPGCRLAAGEKYGIIRFGSQVAVHFPAGAVCTVRPGDRVRAGLSVIGEWKG